jgi:hypothetical protein
MVNHIENPFDWTTELHDHWTYMQNKHDPVFNKVIAKAHSLGTFDIPSLYQDWNMLLVSQFCSTAWRSGNGYESTSNFSTKGHRFSVCVMDFPTIFGLAHDDFLRDEVITERTIAENELVPLYYPGNENFYGKTHGLLPEYAIFNNIFCNTLTPKRGDRTSIRGSIRTLLLAILDNKPPPSINIFLWIEFMFMVQHGTTYVIYAPYIQRIINYKTDMEFVYDVKHGSYQPHIIQNPMDPPPPLVAATAGTSAVAPASPPVHAPSPPPASMPPPSAALESSHATTRRGKKQNILIKGLKTLISMCRSNNALIRKSHQQMSQRLSTLEERQREVRASMGFETPEPVFY